MLFKAYFLKKKFKKVGIKHKLFGKNITVVGKNISLGDYCSVNNFVMMRCGLANIKIGNFVTISDFVYITTAGLDVEKFFKEKKDHIEKDVVIGNRVWIGAKSIILPGVNIGNNVIIAAGSVVTKDIPNNSTVAGVPAKIIKSYQ